VLHLQLAESWLQKLADERDFAIAIGEQYQLHHFKIGIQPGLLNVEGEIIEKPGSVIKLTCIPIWNAAGQKITLEEVDIKTKSKNLLVKSAGWMASAFMQEKIDKKLEEQINQLYLSSLEKLISKPFTIPIKGHGEVTINAESLIINHIVFQEGRIDVEVVIDGGLGIGLFRRD